MFRGDPLLYFVLEHNGGDSRSIDQRPGPGKRCDHSLSEGTEAVEET